MKYSSTKYLSAWERLMTFLSTPTSSRRSRKRSSVLCAETSGQELFHTEGGRIGRLTALLVDGVGLEVYGLDGTRIMTMPCQLQSSNGKSPLSLKIRQDGVLVVGELPRNSKPEFPESLYIGVTTDATMRFRAMQLYPQHNSRGQLYLATAWLAAVDTLRYRTSRGWILDRG
jgi:hypothetical protein